MVGHALSAGGAYLHMVVVDLVNKAENNSFIKDEYFDYYRIYKCKLNLQFSLHRVYVKSNLSINSLSFMTKKCRIRSKDLSSV